VGLRGKARAGLAKKPGEFATAEADLLEAQGILVKLRGEKGKETGEWTQGLVDLCVAWDRAEPGKGYDAKAGEWKTKLPKTAVAPSLEKR
jgi:hypothetical protein